MAAGPFAANAELTADLRIGRRVSAPQNVLADEVQDGLLAVGQHACKALGVRDHALLSVMTAESLRNVPRLPVADLIWVGSKTTYSATPLR